MNQKDMHISSSGSQVPTVLFSKSLIFSFEYYFNVIIFMKDKIFDSLNLIGHTGEPKIAYGILYQISDESKFVTGSELVGDGGFTCKLIEWKVKIIL